VFTFYQLLDALFYCTSPKLIFHSYATKVVPPAYWLK
jgi:hypothetical protein